MFYRDPETEGDPNQPDFYYNGANRSIDTTYTKANMLQRIYYPEGGYSEFEYENNSASESHTYLGSDNIFEPYEDQSIGIHTLNNPSNMTSVFIDYLNRDAYVMDFTIDAPVAQKGRLVIESSSTIWDQTDVLGDPTYDENGPFINLPEDGTSIRFYIREVNNGIVGNIVGHPYGVPIGYDPTIYLEPGDYQLQLVMYDVDGGNVYDPLTDPSAEDIIVRLNWKTRLFPYKTIGGLRIKSIKDYSGYEYTTVPSTPTPIMAKHRTYEYIRLYDGDQSDWIAGVPVFKQITVLTEEIDNSPASYYVYHYRNKLSSNNVFPLITTQSNYVGYTNVIESIVDHVTNPKIIPHSANDIPVSYTHLTLPTKRIV